MKIYKVRGCDTFSQWDMERLKGKPFEVFVYNYIDGGYSGTGFALWLQDGKFGYAYLGHCSCNGPLEDLNSILYTLEEIKQLADKGEWGWQYSKPVIARMEKYLESTRG